MFASTKIIFGLSVYLGLLASLSGQEASPPFYPNRTNLLLVKDADGTFKPVKTAADWELRCAHIRTNLELVMGRLPAQWKTLPLDLKVMEQVELPAFTRKKISYLVDPDDWETAYLLVPRDCTNKRPAVLCLHQTIAIGKEEPAGLGGSPDLHYAQELAERGYVTLAPDYWDFGDYREKKYDPYEHGYRSGTMKGIWNHIRSVDVLQSLPEVDADRIGCLGHSLGGHNTLWLGVFEPRIKVLISSCGFSSMASYAASAYGGGNLKNYAQRRYMPLIADRYDNDPNRLPFDWPEVLAVLAPRFVFINAPLQDLNFEVAGVRDCLAAVQPVYAWLGAKDRLKVMYPDTGHSFPPEVRNAAYAFIDQFLNSPR